MTYDADCILYHNEELPAKNFLIFRCTKSQKNIVVNQRQTWRP